MQRKKPRKLICLNLLECSLKKDLTIILIRIKILKSIDIIVHNLIKSVNHLTKLWTFSIKRICFQLLITILKISQININLEFSKVVIISYKMPISITVI